MIGKGLLIAAMTVLTGFVVNSSHICAGIVEENDYWIPEPTSGVRFVTGIDEATYNEILDRVQAVYGPYFDKLGKKLIINRDWSNGTVNAYAQQFFGRWMVTFPGGLPRHPAVTADGFALVACHEVGHHIGGYPVNFFPRMSIEGQADYFANTKCLRNIFTPESNQEFIANNSVDEYAAASCQHYFANENDWITCVRGAMAGMSVSVLFKDLRREDRAPAFDQPDPAQVRDTVTSHPDTQCRLDTYFQGSLCVQDKSIPFSKSNEQTGACTLKQGHTAGMRPRCWFAPSN